MDKKIRELKRELAQNPDDEQLLTQLVGMRIRMGEANLRRFYKVRCIPRSAQAGSESWLTKSRDLGKQGTQFKSEDEAISALMHFQERWKLSHTHKGLKFELVMYEIHTVETKIRDLDAKEEAKQRRLKEIQRKKKQLEKEEKQLMGKD